MDTPDTVGDVAHDDPHSARPPRSDGSPPTSGARLDASDPTAGRWSEAIPAARRRPVGNPRRVRM